MKCSECRENLSVYIDGELPEAEQHDIALHVRDCPDCAAVLERMRRAVHALSCMPQEAPPPDFMVRLNERLDAEDLRRSRRPWFFLNWPYLLPGAATIAVACLAIVLVSRFMEIPLPDSTPQQVLPRISQQQDKLASGNAKVKAELKSAPAVMPQAEAERKNLVASQKEQLRASQPETRPAPGASATIDTASAMKNTGGAATPGSFEWRGSTSGIQEPTAVAIYDEEAWAKLWQRHAPEIPAPKIDFNRFMALAVFQGLESQERCCLKITGIIKETKKIRAFFGFDETASEKGSGPFSSFHIKLIKKSAAFVVFMESGEEKQPGETR